MGGKHSDLDRDLASVVHIQSNAHVQIRVSGTYHC